MTAPELPFSLLYVHGPGGIGKTSLLQAFQRTCAAQEVPYGLVDGQHLPPLPDAFSQALDEACGPAPEARFVLFLDGFEHFADLEDWLRATFLPTLSGETLVVIASRQPPGPRWQADPGWQLLTRIVPLRNFTPQQSHAYLTQRGIAEDRFEEALRFTHGHPLALSLAADLLAQQPNQPLSIEPQAGLIRPLLDRFVQQVPSPAHRAALEACALVRTTTEGTLAELLETPNAYPLFSWLRNLSFIDASAEGLRPNPVAREVLMADLRWRNPTWHEELHRRARLLYTEQLKKANDADKQHVLTNYVFLYQDHPVLQTAVRSLQNQWQDAEPLRLEPVETPHRQAVADLVAQHEGPAAGTLAERYCQRFPACVQMVRNTTGTIRGALVTVPLHETTPTERAADPGLAAAWAYLRQHAALRGDETALLSRFWMADETYQQISPVQSLISVQRVRQYLYTPHLAFSIIACADPDFWTPFFAYVDFQRLPDADFTLEGRTYALFGHDWRVTPPMQWLDQLAAAPLPLSPPESEAPHEENLIVLSQPDFTEAIRSALQHYARPDRLHGHPLLHARIVQEHAPPDADEATRIETLRTRLKEAAEALLADAREARYFRALNRTYLHPAASQEAAAERIGVPYSTFRRHLKRGFERVVEQLWLEEVGG